MKIVVAERDFQAQVLDLLAMYGFTETMHIRPAMQIRGRWETPVQGSLGKGWPDWVFIRPRDGKTLFRELKKSGGKPSPDQLRVLSVLVGAGLDADWWEPADLDSGRIEKEIR